MFTTTPCLQQRLASNENMLKASPVAFAEPHEKGSFNIPVDFQFGTLTPLDYTCARTIHEPFDMANFEGVNEQGPGVLAFAQRILDGLGHVTSEEIHGALMGTRPPIIGAA
ncbi:hypothetical protein D3C71_78260 [compost metagenome]